jgi:two-component system CheB/CheR fusion protein
VLVGCRRSGETLRIQVWDTGIGIPAKELDAIFEEFYQAPGGGRRGEAGLGLGLAIVRSLSQLLGHPIQVRSRPGRGSMFEVAVPLADPRAVNYEEVAPGRGQRRRAVILVIDDDGEVLDGLRLSLEQVGHHVIACSDPDSALRLASQLGRPPDLIISDYRLGESVTGAEAIQRLRTELGAEIPAIVVTGDSSSAALREVRGAGFPVLHKPVDPDEIELAIAQALASALGTASQ